ncbi:L-lactate dehydrogenase [Leifsonia sp. H3M29-4]|uniref:L-lactate dehydrogenase n=1 Tax=Salinibacterium metalliresistens TaxID=3031321 RepID=UPI0023DA612B|nr:L-lactate dehydrogenase [Salinibacterium metalliresistens]MDF1479586.1 L-lactate dehydrogenase [Salinibacterium metalliresistens]
MSVIENSKLTIIGAGAVGTSVAYAAMIRESAREIALYDIRPEKVEAEVLDLAHGSQFTGSASVTGGTDLTMVEGSNVVVITAGAKQHPGQSRLDLAAVNVELLRDMMPKLVERAPNAVFMVVSNPCDVLAVAAQRISGLPPARVFASGTVLDSSRLRWLLGQRLGVSTSSVHAMIVGEHGDSEFALWSQARIGPVPILEWQPKTGTPLTLAELAIIAEDVKTAAYRVIVGKGATNYAIGLSAARTVEAILRDEGVVLPVSSVLHDYHGIDGIALSVPSVVDAGGVSHVIDVPYSVEEAQSLTRSAQTLGESLAALGI